MLNPTEILMSEEAAFLHPTEKAGFELFEGLELSLSILVNIDMGIPIFYAYPEGSHVSKFLVCIILTLVYKWQLLQLWTYKTSIPTTLYFLFFYFLIYLLIMLLGLSHFHPFTQLHPAHPLPPTFPPYSSCPWVILI